MFSLYSNHCLGQIKKIRQGRKGESSSNKDGRFAQGRYNCDRAQLSLLHSSHQRLCSLRKWRKGKDKGTSNNNWHIQRDSRLWVWFTQPSHILNDHQCFAKSYASVWEARRRYRRRLPKMRCCWTRWRLCDSAATIIFEHGTATWAHWSGCCWWRREGWYGPTAFRVENKC